MSEPFLAEIRMFGGNFAPRGWAFCNGQLMSISQNTALFSLLGTYYGGDGKVTFALPNLQGASPLHWGSGPGLTPRDLGEVGGANNVELISTEMPAHTHQATCDIIGLNPTGEPKDAVWYQSEGEGYGTQPPARGNPMAVTSLLPTGGGQPHNNMQPYLAVSFIIALEGIFPSRN